MVRVLQQRWINGKACLVADEELDDLLDVLNLSSEEVEDQKEADPLSDIREEDLVADEHLPEDAENTSVALDSAGEAEEEAGVLAEAPVSEEVPADPAAGDLEPVALELMEYEAQDAEPEDDDRVVAWIYWPNGVMIKQ